MQRSLVLDQTGLLGQSVLFWASVISANILVFLQVLFYEDQFVGLLLWGLCRV